MSHNLSYDILNNLDPDTLRSAFVPEDGEEEVIDYSMSCPEWPGLGKVAEESGELGRIIGKLMVNRGDPNYWGDLDLVDELHDEVGDLVAALSFFVEMCPHIDPARVSSRADRKLEKLKHWKDTNQ